MTDRIVANVLGYVRGTIKNGAKTEDWKVVLDKGLIWLENKTIATRVRGELN
jgi:hypothetical protein